MPHIKLPPDLPGILGPFAFRPETAKILCELAQTLLRGPSSLTPGERELIASYVSSRNECHFCFQSHAGAARALLDGRPAETIAAVLKDLGTAPVSAKMKALLKIAGKVQKDGRTVSKEDVALARQEGATDVELHDTVLIAAAFCMYNRYVDGLATEAPPAGSPAYDQMGQRLATQGYIQK